MINASAINIKFINSFSDLNEELLEKLSSEIERYASNGRSHLSIGLPCNLEGTPMRDLVDYLRGHQYKVTVQPSVKFLGPSNLALLWECTPDDTICVIDISWAD